MTSAGNVPSGDVLAHPAFHLRRNPFEPEIRVGSQTATFRYGSGPLDPRASDSHLRLLFNLYSWMDKAAIDGLDSNGRLIRLQRLRPDHMMVILISGVSGSGRTSVRNLVLYEIQSGLQRAPLLVESTVRVFSNPQQNALDLAMLLQAEVEDLPNIDLADDMAKTLERWQKNTIGGSPNPDTLFSLLRRQLDKHLSGQPVVFSLDALSYKVSSDVWRPICAMLGQLADFIIVSLTKTDDARAFRTNLANGEFQVSWIDAPRISHNVMKQFLELRLSQERSSGTGPTAGLTPFTLDALRTTFATPDETGQQELTIRVAMARLAGVFDWKCRKLSEAIAAVGGNTAALPPHLFEITAQDVRDYLKSP